MAGRREDVMLKAATGLEGGLVASGSTCGVITGGSLGMALMAGHQEPRQEVMARVSRYVEWFRSNFATTQCRERTSVDFYKASGQLKYFIPVKVGRCFWHTGLSMAYIRAQQEAGFVKGEEDRSESTSCAGSVLKFVREETGIGDTTLEESSFVLDGGVGYSGGLCGALAGAVMATNITFGWDIRNMSYPKTVKGFFIGHLNLLRRRPQAGPESFLMGKTLLTALQKNVPALECSRIIGRRFAGADDFHEHIRSSPVCSELIRASAGEAVRIISKYTRS